MPELAPQAEVRNVVAGVDFSPVGELALEHVLELASDDPNVEPHFVHVAQAQGALLRVEIGEETRTLTLEQATSHLVAHVERHLDALRKRRSVRFARAVTHVRVGSPAEQITELALELDADLVVVGTHGRRGIRRMLLGSVAEAVIRLAPCPVYVVRPKYGAPAQPTAELRVSP